MIYREFNKCRKNGKILAEELKNMIQFPEKNFEILSMIIQEVSNSNTF